MFWQIIIIIIIYLENVFHAILGLISWKTFAHMMSLHISLNIVRLQTQHFHVIIHAISPSFPAPYHFTLQIKNAIFYLFFKH